MRDVLAEALVVVRLLRQSVAQMGAGSSVIGGEMVNAIRAIEQERDAREVAERVNCHVRKEGPKQPREVKVVETAEGVGADVDFPVGSTEGEEIR